ncbi:MAG: GNAT family N-acetyltransferase [Flavobacteriaceae bacterium]
MFILETERLLLEQAAVGDSAFFLALMNSNTWLQFIGDRGVYTEALAQAYIEERLIHSYSEHGFGLWKVVEKKLQLPIGVCGFVKRDFLAHADLGFAFLPSHEGQGYALEAAEACLLYGLKHLHLNPILALTTIENVKSRKLLQKIGMLGIGTVRPDANAEEFLLFTTAPQG